MQSFYTYFDTYMNDAFDLYDHGGNINNNNINNQ